MNPPAGPIREELNDALVGGIRQRGPQAFGLVIMGIARLIVAVLTFAVLYGFSWAFNLEISAGPFVGMSAVSALVSWLITKDVRWGVSKDSSDRSSDKSRDESEGR